MKQVRHGRKGAKHGYCHSNALRNWEAMRTKHLDLVLDGDPSNVHLMSGSMGFGSKQEIWWEFGNPKWQDPKQFYKRIGHNFDAHCWVEYTSKNGNTIILDPWFNQYSDVCDIRNVEVDEDGRAERHYHAIEDWADRNALIVGMMKAEDDRKRMGLI
jgi:hypothetical protein